MYTTSVPINNSFPRIQGNKNLHPDPMSVWMEMKVFFKHEMAYAPSLVCIFLSSSLINKINNAHIRYARMIL